MEPVIGIDLGTTYSAVATVEGGKPIIIPSRQGSRLTPSVVGFTALGDRVVGERAQILGDEAPDRVAPATKRFIGSNGKVEALECVRMEWVAGEDGRQVLQEVAGSEFQIKADLVLLAMGFVGPRHNDFITQASVELDPRGNVKAPVTNYQTTASNIFSCGDMRRGQSLVVWAIREGRQCAQAVDEYLMGTSKLPR